MGKLQEFSIQFANNMDVFMPGQWVTGQVVVDLSDEMKMRGIELTFKGKGHVEWRENKQVNDGGEPEQEEVRYWADEEFLDREITVLGKDESGDNRTLDAGHHVFPFQYQLPQDGLPTSFEGAHGYIRYSVIGKIDKPWKFDHKTKRAFTVLDMVDLNQQPTAMTPLRGQESKTLCCLCCASGPIELQVMAERSAYCPGELINIRGSLENNSSSRITKIKARLKQNQGSSAVPVSSTRGSSAVPVSSARGNSAVPVSSARGNSTVPVSSARGSSAVPVSSARGNSAVPVSSARGRSAVPVSSARGSSAVPVSSARGNSAVPVSSARGSSAVPVSSARGSSAVPEVVYNADHPEHKPRPITKDLGTAEEGGCEEGGTVDLNLTLPVPAVPPSNLRYCSLINLSYKLDVSAHFDGAHTSMELSFPILVGSIPLRSIYPTPPAFPPPPVPSGFDAAYPPPNPGAYPPPNPGAYPPPNPGGPYPPSGSDAVYPPPGAPYAPPDGGLAPPPVSIPGADTPNLPPASYMQSVFGESNIRDDDDNEYIRGTLNYAPKYPYYNWSQHPQI
ncbi:hypothetical protein Bbelb_197970 [Branchiostoma belcheri]|nr:hypothetical protein Bbelb_197970 [Branchiostoma belcheri]